jgi:hypothetical protein
MRIAVLGVDLGKNLCSLVGLDASGAVVSRRRAKRETVIALAAKLSSCIVGMEACCAVVGYNSDGLGQLPMDLDQ